jgi:hypothetical protein
MANDNSKLELVIEVNTDSGNAKIKKFNDGLSDLEKSAKKSAGSFEKFGGSIKDFLENPLDGIREGMQSFLKTLGPVAVGIGAIGIGLLAGTTAAYKFAEGLSDAAEQTQNLAYSTGMTVERVQALQLAGKLSGLGDLTGKMERLNVQLGKGEGDFIDALRNAGISRNADTDVLDYLEQLRSQFIKIESPIARTQKAASVLGTRLMDLVPILVNDKENFIALIREIENGGAVMSGKTIDNFLQLDMAIDSNTIKWEMAKNSAKGFFAELLSQDLNQLNAVFAMVTTLADYQVGKINRLLGIKPTVKLDKGEGPINPKSAYVAGTPIKVEWEGSAVDQFGQWGVESGIERDKALLKIGEKILKEEQKRVAAVNQFKSLMGYVPGIGLNEIDESSIDGITGAGGPATEAYYKKVLEESTAVNEAVKESGQSAWDAQRDYAIDRINEIKSAAGSIFDALLSGGENVWRNLLRTFQSILLTPIKMAFQNIAASLFSGGGFGGGLGRIFGGGGLASSAMGIGASAMPGLLGGAGASAGLSGYAASLGVSAGGAGAGIGLGGGAAAAKMGAFMTNPWTIGIAAAAIGAFAIWKLFSESPEDKMKKEIKSVYGVSVNDRGVLKQLVGIAQSNYGGNYKMAARSQQVSDIVGMYAQATGQSARGLRASMTGASLTQSGGSLYQTAGGESTPIGGGFTGMGLDSLTGTSRTNGTTVINISVPGAKQFFESETVQVIARNGRVVNQSSMSALASNSNRRAMTSLQLAPGRLTS